MVRLTVYEVRSSGFSRVSEPRTGQSPSYEPS